MEELLQAELNERHLTLNTFVSQLFTKYFQWDKYAEKMGLIHIPRELYLYWGSIIKEEKIPEFTEKNHQATKDAVVLWFGEYNLENLLKWFAWGFRHSWTGLKWEQKVQGRKCTLTLRHVWGERGGAWSQGFSQFLSVLLKDSFDIDEPDIEMSANQVAIRFTIPPVRLPEHHELADRIN